MGKQAYDRRAALANALNSSGAAVAVPPKPGAKEKEPAQPAGGKGKGRRKKEPSPEPERKTKSEREEEKRQFVEENERKRKEFYETEAAKKIAECQGADVSFTRASGETSHDFLSQEKFAQFIYEHSIFDVPKLIDICAIYGDSNRTTVTKIVHSVLTHQPKYKENFREVAKHMLGGLRQCCAPLQLSVAPGGSSAAGASSSSSSNARAQELSVEECLAFLPDILCCFNALFCFFPEECVELLLGGSLDGGLPLADLMVVLHESVTALQQGARGAELPHGSASACKTIVAMLSRLLSCVLGFRMAPRHGAGALSELLEWLKDQADHGSLLGDLGKHGLENVAMEWLASGLADDAQLDYMEQLCGPLLPKEARARQRRAAKAPPRSATANGAGAASSSSGQAPSSAAPATDAGKIREVREVVGTDYGEGFVLQCLLHYSGSVPAVVGAILDGSLPPQLAALPTSLGITQDPSAALQPSPERAKLSAADKQRVFEQASRMEAEAAAAAAAAEEAAATEKYDDDFDESNLVPGFNIGGNQGSDSEASGASEAASSEESAGERWPGGKGGRKGGHGKGKGRGREGPVQGQTIQARRKEENKAKVANHNRRDAALKKMRRGM